MPSLIENAKYASWSNTHNFDNCKLNRKDYGQFLASYITGEKDGFVLNLNGSWGTGKTEFLKRLYVELLTREHPTVYIDAWESDFSKDPLTVVTSELLTQVEKFNVGFDGVSGYEATKKALGRFMKGVAIGAAAYASKKILDDASPGTEFVKSLYEAQPEAYLKHLTDSYSDQMEAISEIKAALGELAVSLNETYGTELPIVVLIDELDRCRPTYSIEMLEVIKHFFNIPNFVFVIATDTDQLSHSISAVYGDRFESKQYLKRFFNRKSSLPEPDVKHYLAQISDVVNGSQRMTVVPSGTTHNQVILDTIEMCSKAYSLKLRDIDQLTAKAASCYRYFNNIPANGSSSQYALNVPALIIGLIEQDKDIPQYYERRTDKQVRTSDFSHIDIMPGLKFSSFAHAALETCSYKTEFLQNDFGQPSSIRTIASPSNIDMYVTDNQSEGYTALRSFLRESFNAWENRHIKLWMWDDLKKVIELAGTVE